MVPMISVPEEMAAARRLLNEARNELAAEGATIGDCSLGMMVEVPAAAIAIDAGDPDACLIADTFHLFRGGSGFDGLRHLSGSFIADFHWNDVPAAPPRTEQGDKHRIYPGDGILPLVKLLKDLRAIDYTGPLSLEMFNEEHYKQDPKLVAETGRRKMLDLIEAAMAT